MTDRPTASYPCEPATYRKKPVEIQAVQLTDDADWLGIAEWSYPFTAPPGPEVDEVTIAGLRWVRNAGPLGGWWCAELDIVKPWPAVRAYSLAYGNAGEASDA